MNREKNFIKNVVILGFGKFMSKFFNIITLPLVTLHLTKADYGLFELVSTLILLLTPLVTLQIQSATFRFLIDCYKDVNKEKKIITNMFLFVFPISIIASIFLLLFMPNVAVNERIIISLYLFSDIIYNSVIQLARGLGKGNVYSISSVIMTFVYMIGIILMVKIGKFDLFGVILAIVIANFVSIFYVFKKTKILKYIDFSLKSKKKIKEMILYSWPMIFNNLSNWVLSMSDRFVITLALGLVANADYAVANKIPQMLLIIQQVLVMAWQENASIVVKDDDAGEYYTKMFNNAFSLLIGFTSLLICVSPILFSLLIKGDYESAFMQLPILIVAMFFSTMSAFLNGIFIAHKKTKSVASTTVIAAIINLIIDIALINKIGIYAASLSTLIAYVCIYIIRMIKLKNIQKIDYNIKRQLLCIPIIIFMSLLLGFRDNKINIINCLIGITFFVILNIEIIKKILRKIKLKNKH